MSIAAAPAPVHRELEFLRLYNQLITLALKLPDSDRGLARDVVHDAFVQFMSSSTDFDTIDNIDLYLHKVVRNVHRTYVRQRVAARFEQLSEADAIDAPGSFFDPQEAIQTRNLLLTVCRYLCERKETSIASSILVLRFLHGYYPNEVARLTRRSRSAVDVLLKAARREVKLYLIGLLSYCQENVNRFQGSDFRFGLISDVAGIRSVLFEARKGQCLDITHLESIYLKGKSKLSRRELSHMVSCQRCLDKANELLELPLLRERSPIDMLHKIPIVLSSLILIANLNLISDLYSLWQQTI